MPMPLPKERIAELNKIPDVLAYLAEVLTKAAQEHKIEVRILKDALDTRDANLRHLRADMAKLEARLRAYEQGTPKP